MTDIKTVQALVEALQISSDANEYHPDHPTARECDAALAAGRALIAQMQREAVQPESRCMYPACNCFSPQGPQSCAHPAPHPEAQALDSQLQQPDGHSTRASGVCASTVQPASMGCACRWVGSEHVERCDFHDAWHTALHEWADRARTAEALLRELRSCKHHDPYAKKSWTNSQGRWVTANVPADLWSRIEAVASTGADTARHGSDEQAESASPSVLLIRGEK